MVEPEWRPLGQADAEAWAELMRSIPHRHRPVDSVDVVAFRAGLARTGLSAEAGMGVFDGPVLLGWACVRPAPADPERGEVQCGLRPDRCDVEVHARLLDWALGRAARRTSEPHRVGIWCAEHERERIELVTARGLRPALWFHEVYSRLDQVAPLEPKAMPAGLVLQAYTPALDEAVRAAHNDAFDGQAEDGSMAAPRWRDEVTGHPDFLPDLSFVVLDPDGVVVAHLLAFAYDASADHSGQQDLKIEYLGVRRSQRGRFLDRALIAANDRVARDRGYRGMSFSVDSANPSGVLRILRRIGVYDPERDDRTTWIRFDTQTTGPVLTTTGEGDQP